MYFGLVKYRLCMLVHTYTCNTCTSGHKNNGREGLDVGLVRTFPELFVNTKVEHETGAKNNACLKVVLKG